MSIPYLLPRSLRFKIGNGGELRGSLSPSSGDYILTPETLLCLCLIQRGIPPEQLDREIRTLLKETTRELPSPRAWSEVLDSMVEEGFLRRPHQEKTVGTQDFFGDFWIQWAMLSDRKRMEAYGGVLQKRLQKNQTVLDLGAGTGIWSYCALKNGAKHVFMIEESSMAGYIPGLLGQMGYEKKKDYTLFNANSFDVSLDNPLDVVISELFGHDPLEEGLIPTLQDIYSRFSITDKTVCIPESLDVYAQLVDLTPQSPLFSRIGAWQNPSQEGLGEFTSHFRGLFQNQPLSFRHRLSPGDFVCPLPAKRLFTLDLGPHLDHIPHTTARYYDININSSFQCPVFILWYRIHLGLGFSISTHPQEPDCGSHWEPVLIPCHSSVLPPKLRPSFQIHGDLCSVEWECMHHQKLVAKR